VLRKNVGVIAPIHANTEVVLNVCLLCLSTPDDDDDDDDDDACHR
jgi:hypothetical protein